MASKENSNPKLKYSEYPKRLQDMFLRDELNGKIIARQKKKNELIEYNKQMAKDNITAAQKFKNRYTK